MGVALISIYNVVRRSALTKKGLKPPFRKLIRILKVIGSKKCPDEEGIETPIQEIDPDTQGDRFEEVP